MQMYTFLVNQRQHKHHNYADNNLQGQAHTHIVNRLISTCRHDKGIGRCGERRGKTHTSCYGYCHQHGHCTDALCLGCLQGYGRHKHGCYRVRYKEREQRGGYINGGYQHVRTIAAYPLCQILRNKFGHTRLLQGC